MLTIEQKTVERNNMTYNELSTWNITHLTRAAWIKEIIFFFYFSYLYGNPLSESDVAPDAFAELTSLKTL